MENIVTIYCIYLPLVIALTIWTAKTLHQNSAAFLKEIFTDDEAVAKAVNNLVQTGYYLVSLGYGFLQLKITLPNSAKLGLKEQTSQTVIELLAVKTGGFALFEGGLVIALFLLLLSIRRATKLAVISEERVKQYWHQQNLQQPQQRKF
jgi:hypothetical protein